MSSAGQDWNATRRCVAACAVGTAAPRAASAVSATRIRKLITLLIRLRGLVQSHLRQSFTTGVTVPGESNEEGELILLETPNRRFRLLAVLGLIVTAFVFGATSVF